MTTRRLRPPPHHHHRARRPRRGRHDWGADRRRGAGLRRDRPPGGCRRPAAYRTGAPGRRHAGRPRSGGRRVPGRPGGRRSRRAPAAGVRLEGSWGRAPRGRRAARARPPVARCLAAPAAGRPRAGVRHRAAGRPSGRPARGPACAHRDVRHRHRQAARLRPRELPRAWRHRHLLRRERRRAAPASAVAARRRLGPSRRHRPRPSRPASRLRVLRGRSRVGGRGGRAGSVAERARGLILLDARCCHLHVEAGLSQDLQSFLTGDAAFLRYLVDALLCHWRTKSMVSCFTVTGARSDRARARPPAISAAHSGRTHT